MSHHLIIDRTVCAGHGVCYSTVPELLGCDDEGYPVISPEPVPEALLDEARHVVRTCPEQALYLRDE